MKNLTCKAKFFCKIGWTNPNLKYKTSKQRFYQYFDLNLFWVILQIILLYNCRVSIDGFKLKH